MSIIDCQNCKRKEVYNSREDCLSAIKCQLRVKRCMSPFIPFQCGECLRWFKKHRRRINNRSCIDKNPQPKEEFPDPIEGPYFTRHNQIAYITRIDGIYGHGYIIGDDGKKNKYSWYACKSSTEMPYIGEADYPSGRDLSVKPSDDPLYWSSDENKNINAKNRL